MEYWLRNFFDWLPDGPAYYLLAGTVALLESLTGVGLLVPGTILTVFAGFLAYHGKGDFSLLFAAAAGGALLGDFLSYWLGGRLGASIIRSRLLRRRTDLLRRAEIFFTVHGGKSIFFGRFVGPLRGFIPFIAGCTRMPPGQFFPYTLISALLWGAIYPGLGYLGGASWQKATLWTGRLGLLIGMLLILFLLNLFIWKKVSPHPAHNWRRKRWLLLLIFIVVLIGSAVLLLARL